MIVPSVLEGVLELMKLKRILTVSLMIVLCLSMMACSKTTETYEEEGFVMITDVIPVAMPEN